MNDIIRIIFIRGDQKMARKGTLHKLICFSNDEKELDCLATETEDKFSNNGRNIVLEREILCKNDDGLECDFVED